MGGLIALLSALGFTCNSVFTRKGLMEENAGSIWEIRYVITFTSLLLFLIGVFIASFFGFNIIQEFKHLSFIAILLLVLHGAFGDLLGAFFITIAVAQIGASHSSALRGGSNPLFATILAIVFLGEKPGILGILFVLIIITGIIVTGYRDHTGTVALIENTRIAGGVYALLSGFSFALSQVARGSAIYLGATPNTGFFIGMTTTLIIISIICFVKLGRFTFPSHVNRRSLFYYSIAGIGNFIGCYALFTAFTLIPVWQATAIRNVQPLLTILMTWIFFKEVEKINLRLAVGAFLVTLGVVALNVFIA